MPLGLGEALQHMPPVPETTDRSQQEPRLECLIRGRGLSHVKLGFDFLSLSATSHPVDVLSCASFSDGLPSIIEIVDCSSFQGLVGECRLTVKCQKIKGCHGLGTTLTLRLPYVIPKGLVSAL
jgi:hypothetical protein